MSLGCTKPNNRKKKKTLERAAENYVWPDANPEGLHKLTPNRRFEECNRPVLGMLARRLLPSNGTEGPTSRRNQQTATRTRIGWNMEFGSIPAFGVNPMAKKNPYSYWIKEWQSTFKNYENQVVRVLHPGWVKTQSARKAQVWVRD